MNCVDRLDCGAAHLEDGTEVMTTSRDQAREGSWAARSFVLQSPAGRGVSGALMVDDTEAAMRVLEAVYCCNCVRGGQGRLWAGSSSGFCQGRTQRHFIPWHGDHFSKRSPSLLNKVVKS